MNERQRKIFDQVSYMETQIGELYEQLGALKKDLSEVIEENHRLTMENNHLRAYLDQEDSKKMKDKQIDKEKATVPSEGIDNLARIYKDGFHVCHMQFGSPRSEEDCLFCLDMIR